MNINPQFGKITVQDIKPGAAIVTSSPNKNFVYVVTEVTGKPRHIEDGTVSYSKKETPSGQTYTIPLTSKPHTHLPYKADIYTLQYDGTYVKTGESNSPVGMTDGDKNKYHDIVDVSIDGNRLTIVG